MLFTVIGLILILFPFAQKVDAQPMMGMCSAMMNKVPKDVTISSASPQAVSAGQEATIILLVKDRQGDRLLSAQIQVMIERGPPMSTMDMMGSMTLAQEIGSGKYQVKFTPDGEGIYTIHTHVIPEGKSMMSMMSNHMDIGIIAK